MGVIYFFLQSVFYVFLNRIKICNGSKKKRSEMKFGVTGASCSVLTCYRMEDRALRLVSISSDVLCLEEDCVLIRLAGSYAVLPNKDRQRESEGVGDEGNSLGLMSSAKK